jgi:hypothetical protein
MSFTKSTNPSGPRIPGSSGRAGKVPAAPQGLGGDATALDRLRRGRLGYPPLHPLFARKTANEVVNNSATLQDDNDLRVQVDLGTVYVVDGLLLYGSGTTADLKAQWVGPAGATFDWTPFGLPAAATGAAGSVDAAGKVIGDVQVLGGVGVGSKVAAGFRGLLVVAGASGTFKLQWAQNAADPSDTTVYAGSWLRVQKVA